jgi:ribosomal protein S18 acetylase RimI-like enzyme
MNFQAPEFYSKMGFEKYIELPDYAGQHSCHYFIKRL